MLSLLKSKIEHNLSNKWTRAALIAFVCLSVLFYLLASNVAYAVVIDGELVGYAGTVDEITTAMDSVEATASCALGYDYALESSVTYELTLGQPDESISATVEEKLLDNIDSIGLYSIVCIDGVPFCAFESTEAASSALSAYIALFTSENTVSAHFSETVSIKVDYADTQLLSVAASFNSNAADILHVETTDHITEETAIPFDTTYIKDETVLSGDTYVESEGINGESRILRELNSINGTAVSSTILESDIISAPETEIIHIGTGERHSTGTYIWPTEGTISSYYGYRSLEVGSTYHRGVDIAAALGTDVYAADGGKVIYSGEMGGYGNILEIQHDNGDITYYAHCSKLLKKVGDIVTQGELIAYMGSTGVSTGSHLHFEIRPNGESPVDPLDILP